mgnify:CR=1 FL=1
MARRSKIAGHALYSGNPAVANRHRVRFRIGDTDSADYLVSDEEIDAMLTDEGSVLNAAAACAEHLAAYFSREVDSSSTEANLSWSNSQKAEAYRQLAKDLRARATRSGLGGSDGGVYAGGISKDDKEANRDDTDIVQPAFFRGMMEQPGTKGPFAEDQDNDWCRD